MGGGAPAGGMYAYAADTGQRGRPGHAALGVALVRVEVGDGRRRNVARGGGGGLLVVRNLGGARPAGPRPRACGGAAGSRR